MGDAKGKARAPVKFLEIISQIAGDFFNLFKAVVVIWDTPNSFGF